jgi:uncharacterized protein
VAQSDRVKQAMAGYGARIPQPAPTHPEVVSDFPYAVTAREEWIDLSDGCRLFARIVLPTDADSDPVPAVLEYLPYRLGDGTAHRDAMIHDYFAGHGYAAVRVDIRGTGNSDGIMMDEYLPSEQADGAEVIAWLAEQPWCSGAVGLYGKSWGGFNGLQIAARRPPALRAVVAAYFTDDRYADDVHYMGGCLLADEALPWASYMHGVTALPPDPAVVGDRWREMWGARLADTPFYLEEWLRHQRRDAFWRQGSVAEDFSAITVPTLLVGGWADGYTNAVPRTLAGLTAAGVACRALLGPWSHGWPQASEPGPRIGFLQECVRWWDCWLRGADNGAMDVPLLRAYLQEYDPPAPRRPLRSGRWISVPRWPPAGTHTATLLAAGGGRLGGDVDVDAAAVERIAPADMSGSDAGAWCPYGDPTDFPPDQRAEDGRALSYTTQPLADRLEILGVPEMTLTLATDRPTALVAVRLCDVAPDGTSLLVARGLLNLTHRDSHVDLQPMPVGQPITVRVPLDLTGHAFAPDHRIRVSVAPSYWPFAWPSPEPVVLSVHLDGTTRLELPVRATGDEDDASAEPLGPPQHAPPAAGPVTHATWRDVHTSAESRTAALEVGSDEHARLDRAGLEFGEHLTSRFHLRADDPLSARIEHQGEHHLRRGEWDVRVRVTTSMSSTATHFVITRELDAYEGQQRVHAARSATEIPRDGV